MTSFADVIQFWFGFDTAGAIPEERLKFWFGGAPETDRLIRTRFSSLVAEAVQGQLEEWSEDPKGRLALILLLDQFPRNIYRGTPQAYAQDSQALQLSLVGLERGQDRPLSLVERAFFYLPLEHAEDLALQERSMELFGKLLRESPSIQVPVFESFADYARRHRGVIARFGRFPHRNAVLGRLSSPEESAFLRQPGSSF